VWILKFKEYSFEEGRISRNNISLIVFRGGTEKREENKKEKKEEKNLRFQGKSDYPMCNPPRDINKIICLIS
jgi:hypothetical protein